MFDNPFLSRFASAPSLVGLDQGDQVTARLTALHNDPRFAQLQLAAMNGHRRDASDKMLDNDDNFWPEADSWMAQFRPYTVQDGILVIPVKGVLMSGFPYQAWDFATGYEYIWKAFDRGMGDNAVSGIAFDIDSPGGEVQGNFDLVDRMYERRNEKPVRSFANEHAYSAAYSIATVGDKINVGRTGGVGSIGVVTSHVDYSKMLEQKGIKITFIKAGDHKTDGNPYEPLPASVEARIQKRIDKIASIFYSIVARNRGMSEDDVRATQALTYPADEAVKANLADTIGPMDTALATFRGETKPKSKGLFGMTKTAEQIAAETAAAEKAQADALATATATAVQAGAKAAKDRITAILALDEAKTRPIAAQAAAMDTDMTTEQAKAFLAKLPEEGKAPEPSKASAFETAMNNGDNPNLGTGAGAGNESGKPDDKVSAILAAQAAVRGPIPNKPKAAA